MIAWLSLYGFYDLFNAQNSLDINYYNKILTLLNQ